MRYVYAKTPSPRKGEVSLGNPSQTFVLASVFWAALAPRTYKELTMPLIGPKEMFAKAYAGGYAIGAFNVNNMEIIQGIMSAAGQ